jgi:hypothetical protein
VIEIFLAQKDFYCSRFVKLTHEEVQNLSSISHIDSQKTQNLRFPHEPIWDLKNSIQIYLHAGDLNSDSKADGSAYVFYKPYPSLRTQARGCAAYILKNWERGWKPNVREKPLEPPPQWVDKRRLERIKGGLNQEIMQILRLCPPWTLSQQNPVARKILKILNKVS